jgi:hypothetical protein
MAFFARYLVELAGLCQFRGSVSGSGRANKTGEFTFN